ncbi:hypothetical protein PTKIN_Ptkin13bG0304000 [Pterospermum kingtungense]
MVAGRKSQTFQAKVYAPYTSNPNPTRNLSKSQLGGVIFGCKNSTYKECLFKQLFGLPSQHFSYVKNIDPGLPLFLFNYSERKLHGIFEAASRGQMNINPYGWSTDGSEKTQYPAQVQIRVQQQCQPLLEEQFRPIIADNYYTRNHFFFELDHAQTTKLMSLLANLAVPPSTYLTQDKANWRNIFQPLPSTGLKGEGQGEGEGFRPLAPEQGNSNLSGDKLDAYAYFDELKVADEGFKLSASEAEHFSQSSGKSDSTDFAHFDSLETHIDAKTTRQDDKDIILSKLTELAQKRKNQDVPLMDNTLMKEIHFEDREHMDLMKKIEDSACASSHCKSTIAQLVQGLEELRKFKVEQRVKMIQMEQNLVAAEMEIQRLKDRCLMLESLSNHSVEHVNQKVASEMEIQQLKDCSPMLESFSNHSVEHVNEKVVDPSEELQLDPTESIFLLGGYDGESWLSVLNSYFPSQDVIKSVQPMSSVRSYASVAQLNGELYVFGGGDGYSWYDTVESYSPSTDQWTLCPLLKEKKGSLAGAAVDGKIFAIGGGNGIECFSDVEMLDLIVGRWINTRSMLKKRFALAAVELNGSIYATGGYDGNSYLESAERFDPREHSWSKIASMSTKRACHSMVVLDEKLYAVGGFDGTKMVPSVEIFDPRLGSWMAGDPINQPRGYAAAAVVKGSIYVIGGVRASEDIIETVECFKEGEGWQLKPTKAVGKRCFLSAIVLES